MASIPSTLVDDLPMKSNNLTHYSWWWDSRDEFKAFKASVVLHSLFLTHTHISIYLEFMEVLYLFGCILQLFFCIRVINSLFSWFSFYRCLITVKSSELATKFNIGIPSLNAWFHDQIRDYVASFLATTNFRTSSIANSLLFCNEHWHLLSWTSLFVWVHKLNACF